MLDVLARFDLIHPNDRSEKPADFILDLRTKYGAGSVWNLRLVFGWDFSRFSVSFLMKKVPNFTEFVGFLQIFVISILRKS